MQGLFDADLVPAAWLAPYNLPLGWFGWGLPFEHEYLATVSAPAGTHLFIRRPAHRFLTMR